MAFYDLIPYYFYVFLIFFPDFTDLFLYRVLYYAPLSSADRFKRVVGEIERWKLTDGTNKEMDNILIVRMHDSWDWNSKYHPSYRKKRVYL